MGAVGVYFGPREISIVETKGKGVLKHFQVSGPPPLAENQEESVYEGVKLVTLLKGKLTAKEVNICLCGEDLILRTFDLPFMPAEELKSAINFEAKKYLPFKIEELVYDFTVRQDKPSKKNLVCFAAAKKEALDKYLSAFGQLKIKVNTLEYAAFGLIRFLNILGIQDKGVIGLISVDTSDETNFTVWENNFPLFSRDISLASAQAEEKIDAVLVSDKLKTELRVSLDFFKRKLPNKNISKAFLIASADYRPIIAELSKDLGLPLQLLDSAKILGKNTAFSLGLMKSYACALASVIRSGIKLDILAAKEKSRLVKEAITHRGMPQAAKGLKVDRRVIVAGIAICLAGYLLGVARLAPLKKELSNIISGRPAVSLVGPSLSDAELEVKETQYRGKASILNQLVNKRIYLTEVLNVIPRVIPENVWLTRFNFTKSEDKVELILRGMAFSADSEQELILVNQFLANLKNDPDFSLYFKEVNLASIEKVQGGQKTVTQFVFSARQVNP